MDYVREELARQQLALALLMMGGWTQEPMEEQMGTGEREPLSPAEEHMGTEERGPLSPEKQRIQRLSGGGTEDVEGLQPWRQTADGGQLHGPRDGVALDWTAPLQWETIGEERLAEQAFHGEALGGLLIKGLGKSQMSAGGTGMASAGDLAEKMKKRENTPLDGGTLERTVTEVLWTRPAEALGPGELSRMFQRDARRYDGGFSLY